MSELVGFYFQSFFVFDGLCFVVEELVVRQLDEIETECHEKDKKKEPEAETQV